MHVLLVGPDLEENLSLRCLSSALKAAGHATTIAAFDTADDQGKVLEKAPHADLVGLSLCYQVRAPEFLALARALKKARPERPVVAGGHFASCAARELIADFPDLDAIVVHEGERTLAELASLPRLSPEALAGIRGVVYRSGSEVVATAPRDMVVDLDSLPAPDRSGPSRLMVGVPTAYMMGSRGCLSACDYCCISTLHRLVPGKRFRQRSVQNIADEMAHLYHDRGVRQFIFHDDNFLVPSVEKNLERIDGLDRELRRRGVRHVGLALKCRPQDVDRQVFLRLRELGLLRVFLGIESGSASGLASIGRRQSVADEHRALRICEDLGISTQYTIIIFHPEATAETMLEDLAFVKEHLAHPMSFCRAEIYAGTPLEKRMIGASRAFGTYMARAYEYTDTVTEVAWSVVRDLLFHRCWSPNNLMGQVIRTDHLATVFRHFYDGRKVDALKAEFEALELEINRDTVAIFEEALHSVVRSPDLASPELQHQVAELSHLEQSRRADLEGRICALRETLHREAFAMVGLRSPAHPSAPSGGRAQDTLQSLPRHAAAVALAVGMLNCGGSVVVNPHGGTGGGGGYRVDGGVIEAPPPPVDGGIWMNDGGMIEAPPPRVDGGIWVNDGGTNEPVPPPMDAGTWVNDGGVIEAPPPPVDGGTPKYDGGINEMAAAILPADSRKKS